MSAATASSGRRCFGGTENGGTDTAVNLLVRDGCAAAEQALDAAQGALTAARTAQASAQAGLAQAQDAAQREPTLRGFELSAAPLRGEFDIRLVRPYERIGFRFEEEDEHWRISNLRDLLRQRIPPPPPVDTYEEGPAR